MQGLRTPERGIAHFTQFAQEFVGEFGSRLCLPALAGEWTSHAVVSTIQECDRPGRCRTQDPDPLQHQEVQQQQQDSGSKRGQPVQESCAG